MAATDQATQLLEAHVAFVVSQMKGKVLEQWLDETLPPTLEDLAHLKLEAVMPAKVIKASVASLLKKVVIDEAMRDTVQHIAVAILESDAHEDVTLQDILPDEVFVAGRDQSIAMRDMRETIIRALMESRAYRGFVADLLYHGIRGWLSDNPLTQNVPGAKAAFALGRSVLSRARPGLGEQVDERLHEYIDKSVGATAEIGERYALGVDNKALAKGADTVWKQLRKTRVSEVVAHLDAGDVEGWAGIVYDELHHLRGTAYLAALVDAGVDAFYEDFGKRSLRDLLDTVGVTPDIIRSEVKRYVEPVVKQLKKQKLLDAAVRRQLAPFYESAACRKILTD